MIQLGWTVVVGMVAHRAAQPTWYGPVETLFRNEDAHREEVEVVVGGGGDLAAPGRQDAAQPHKEHDQHDADAAQDGALEQRPAMRNHSCVL